MFGRGTILIITGMLIASVSLLAFVATRQVALCYVGEDYDRFERTAEFLIGVIDLTLALSTSLVGLGAALLIGLHPNIRLTPGSMLALLVGLLALAQSAAYGVWWKLQLANLWFNECYNQIASPHVQWKYQSHFGLMFVGIALLAVLVLILSLGRVQNSGGADE